MLKEFGKHIWTLEGPRLHMMCIPFDTRMTVIELEPGRLLLHSPLKPTDETVNAIHELGEVCYLVAPNKIHSLGIQPWQEICPDSQTWCSPEFPVRHPDILVDRVIPVGIPADWNGEIETIHFEGSSFLDEVVFFHHASQTLIITDLIQRHVPERENWFWRVVKGLAGVLGPEGGTSRDLRATMKDMEAARKSAEALLAWEFERVVISHGDCIASDARPKVEAAFAWALT